MKMELFLFCTYLFMFWIGYKFGRRVEKWEGNPDSNDEWKND